MKCQSCGKKEATVRYMENINGKKQELFFCSDCAKNLGVTNLSNIFSPLFIDIPEHIRQEELKCKSCGYTLNDYTDTGLFGCPDCYTTFESELDELFLKIHGKNRHKNETKSTKKLKKEGSSLKDEIEELKKLLQQAVKNEEYEDAAKYRDRIKELEEK